MRFPAMLVGWAAGVMAGLVVTGPARAASVVVRAQIDGVIVEEAITEGQIVKAGDVLLRLDDRSLRADIATDEAALAADQAAVKAARNDLARLQKLLDAQTVSQEAFDQKKAAAATLAAKLQADKIRLQTDHTSLARTVIRAPIGGRVVRINNDVGSIVQATATDGLLTIAEVASPTAASGDVDPAVLAKCKAAQPFDYKAVVKACDLVIAAGDKVSITDRAEAYLNRGKMLDLDWKTDRAVEDMSQSLALNPNSADAYYARAGLYEKKDQHDRAAFDYDAALRLDPKNTDYLYARGLVQLTRNRADLALADFDAMLAIHPDDFGHIGRADALRAQGQYQAAITEYDAVLKIHSVDSAIMGRYLAVTALAQAGEKQSTTPEVIQPASAPVKPATMIAAETRVALIIGNSAYTAVAKLPNPQRDAEAVAEALRQDGFADVQLVIDATRTDLVEALNDFADKADAADWAVVYFAGHGLELDGTNYLVPVDARLKADRDVQDEAVSLDRVIEAVNKAKKLRLVILDACRNNPFVPDMRVTKASRAIHRGLARIEPSGGTLVAYAAKGGEEAVDGDGTADSPFAAALVARLTTPGLEIGKLFRLVRDDVLAATDQKQEPFVYGSLPGSDFFFRPSP